LPRAAPWPPAMRAGLDIFTFGIARGLSMDDARASYMARI
jgi:hypothetical protein